MTLGANKELDGDTIKKKYTWNIKGEKMDVVSDEADPSPSSISLTPMKIRTFVVKFKLEPHSFGNSIKPVPVIFMFTMFMYFFN